MLQLVGHRGVRNIEVENTKSSLLKAQDMGVDAVEFDLRLTKDKKLVVCHNRNLKAIYGINENIDQLNYSEIKDLKSKNSESIPTIEDVLDLNLTVIYMIDTKNSGSADLLYKIINQPKYKHLKWAITTFQFSEAKRFKKLDRNIWVQVGTVLQPFNIIKKAKSIDANAVTLNLILLNPINYLLARRAGLKIMVYMNFMPFLLTSPMLVRILLRLYPGLIICTDRPDKVYSLIKDK